jgi:hypothetical protein
MRRKESTIARHRKQERAQRKAEKRAQKQSRRRGIEPTKWIG